MPAPLPACPPAQGGALGAVACTAGQRHPHDASKPLIDWRLALVLTPMLLLGCTTGVLLNQLLPAWAVTFLLIPLLALLTYRTGTAALRLHRAESPAAASAAASLDLLESDLAPPPGAEPPCVDCAFPYHHALELLALWAVLLTFQFGKHQFDRGTLEFAAIYSAQAVTAIATSAFFVAQAAAARQKPVAAADCDCCGAADAAPAAEVGRTPSASTASVNPLLLAAAGSDSSTWTTKQLAGSSAVALAGGAIAGRAGGAGGQELPLLLPEGIPF